MKKMFFLLLVSWMALSATAQNAQPSWQQLWQSTMNMEDEEEGGMTEDDFELLQDMAEHQLDLNRATRDELERLPFLSSQQVMDFMEYRDRYGPLRSMGELRMIPSMDYQQIVLLPCFTYVGEVADTLRFPTMKNIARYGHHELTGSFRLPFYERKGDRNGYLGYKYRHWLRYEFCYGDYVRLGLMGSQDAGEPFFANRNKWGYDAYTYYLQLRKWGCLDNLVLGKYKISTGMGLVLNNSFSLGKLNVLQSLGRQSNIIRPHASRSVADYFQGAAATVSLGKRLKLTAFASYRPLDATLNSDGTAATLLTDGYHRTPKEMEKKHNTHQTAAGADVAFRYQGLTVGATAVFTHLDRLLSPNTKTLYRRHYAAGRNFLNASLRYGYMHYRFYFSGETAVAQNGALATINALSYQSSGSWSLLALQRFYSYRYTTLHGHAFSEGGRVQNESGIYLGGTWQPFRRLQLKGYADFAYFPWARYRVSQPSMARDYQVEAIYLPGSHWILKGRYRLHLRQQDNQKKTALRRHNEHRARLSATFQQGNWTATTQADYVHAVNDSTSQGWMLSEQVTWHQAWWQLHLMAAYFNTDSYDSRIYAYERQTPHNFAFPMYYGKGLRLALTARANVGRWLQIDAKVGFTRYFDRSVIGSGLQQIDGSSLTDLDLQARWRF